MTDEGTQAVDVIKHCRNSERGCGKRKKHALYLESILIPHPDGTLPRVVQLDPALPMDLPQFRGFVYLNGDELLPNTGPNGRSPGVVSDTLRGQSAETLYGKESEAFDRFGMTWAVRRRVGVARGLTTDEFAQVMSRLPNPCDMQGHLRAKWDHYVREIAETLDKPSRPVKKDDPWAGIAQRAVERARAGDLQGREGLARAWQLLLCWRVGTQGDWSSAVMLIRYLGMDADAKFADEWLAEGEPLPRE